MCEKRVSPGLVESARFLTALVTSPAKTDKVGKAGKMAGIGGGILLAGYLTSMISVTVPVVVLIGLAVWAVAASSLALRYKGEARVATDGLIRRRYAERATVQPPAPAADPAPLRLVTEHAREGRTG